MNIKLVISDVDGTLLNSKGKLTPRVIEAAKKLKENGFLLTLCSSRGYSSMLPIVEQLEIELPVVELTGAVIYSFNENKVLYENSFTLEQLVYFSYIAKKYGSAIAYHTVEGLKVFCSDEYWEKMCIDYAIDPYNPVGIGRCDEDFIYTNSSIVRIDIFDEDEKLELMRNDVNKKYCNVTTYIMYSRLEIINENVNKGTGVKKLAEMLSIPFENVLTMGDDINDISMLELSKYGVAMGNASLEVKKHTNYVAPGFDEDGAAILFEHLVSGSLENLKRKDKE